MIVDTFLGSTESYFIEEKVMMLQQVSSDLFSFLLPEYDHIAIFSCQEQKVIREIQYHHLKVNELISYFISDDLTYLVLVDFQKKKYISKILNLTDNTHYSIKECSIFGIRQGYMLGAVEYHDLPTDDRKVVILSQFELQNEKPLEDYFFYTIGITYFQGFESSYLFVQPLIQRFWLFLNNNKRFQYDQNQGCSGPLQNIAHNKNYYLFGQNNRSQVKYMVRLSSRMKKIRQFVFNPFDQTYLQFGQWIYVRGYNVTTKQFPFYRVNVNNARIEIIKDNIFIQQMIGTKDGKYLVSQGEKTLSIIEIINDQ